MSVSMLQMCLFNLLMEVSRNDFFYSCPVPDDQNVHHMSHVLANMVTMPEEGLSLGRLAFISLQ